MKLINIPAAVKEEALEYPGFTLCRVVQQEKGMYRICGADEEWQGVVSGRFRYEAETAMDYPAVGDYVMADCRYEDTAVIHHILPRYSTFSRKAAGTAREEQLVATNIDVVFVCMSLNRDFNIRRLERYLAAAWDSGAKPVVVLTKADLCADAGEKVSEAGKAAPGVDIIVVTAVLEDGYEQLLPYLTPGRTVAFVGSSGVGKSTLINRLLGCDRMETNGLRDDDRGRHTTTHRELMVLPGQAMVIDTPGMREMGMWDAEDGIRTAFADIEQLARMCRFGNCTHESEPGCAVREAISEGKLSREHWLAYRKLLNENAYASDSESYLAAKEKRYKDIAKYNKTNRKK